MSPVEKKGQRERITDKRFEFSRIESCTGNSLAVKTSRSIGIACYRSQNGRENSFRDMRKSTTKSRTVYVRIKTSYVFILLSIGLLTCSRVAILRLLSLFIHVRVRLKIQYEIARR